VQSKGYVYPCCALLLAKALEWQVLQGAESHYLGLVFCRLSGDFLLALTYLVPSLFVLFKMIQVARA
jgi:hypothetical protein